MIPVFLLNFALSFFSFQTFVVMGTVRDQAGQAVGGIRVSVTDDNLQSVRTILIDASGRFTIRSLVPGRYTFRVETTGTPFEEQTQFLELYSTRRRTGSSETFPLDFILKSKKSKNATPSTSLFFVQEVPNPAKTQFERATNSLKNGDLQAAIEALKKAIEMFPIYFNALELLGAEYVKDNQFDLALPVLTKALEVNRSASKSLYALGVAHLKLNHPTEAVEALRKSAELAPSNPNAPMMLGLAYRLLADFKQAEAAFKKALQIGGGAMAEAHFYLAGIYEKQAMYAEAVRELELYLKEAKGIGNPARIKSLIEQLRGKAKEKSNE